MYGSINNFGYGNKYHNKVVANTEFSLTQIKQLLKMYQKYLLKHQPEVLNISCCGDGYITDWYPGQKIDHYEKMKKLKVKITVDEYNTEFHSNQLRYHHRKDDGLKYYIFEFNTRPKCEHGYYDNDHDSMIKEWFLEFDNFIHHLPEPGAEEFLKQYGFKPNWKLGD